MKKILVSILMLCLGWNAFAQEDQVLVVINGKPITVSEFLYVYEKNNNESSLEKKTMDDYLDLFIDYKLKVAEAESLGIDTTEAFKKEFKGYRAQATNKYLKDQVAIDSLVALSYDRMTRLVHAAHIVVQCPMGSDSVTEAAALARINEARKRVTVGLPREVVRDGEIVVVCEVEDFGDVSAEVSDEPAARRNRGDLGWITPFRYVYVFEDAIYNTPVGGITEVFRSPYGFHVAKVLGVSEYEEVHAAHILKMAQGNDIQRVAEATIVMDSLYNLAIQDTVDFAWLAQNNSEDRGSALRGGDLGWFGRGMMVKQFEDVAFGLEVGEVSKPFASQFGIHIIKLYDKRGIQPLDSIRAKVLRQVERDQRYQIAYESFVRKTRVEYNLPVTMSDAEVIAYADAHLEEKYAEFRNLTTEYHDGILMFEVSVGEIWDKASQDVEGLKKFFKKNKKKFAWEEPRFKGFVIYAKDEVSADITETILKTAHPDSVMNYIKERVNVDSVKYVEVQRGVWKKGANPAIDKFGFMDDSVSYEVDEKFPYVVVIGEVLEAPQEYTDDRGRVTTAYQDHLEAKWVAKLRKKHSWKVNKKVWKAIVKQQESKE